jgi:hypothetical protein
MEDYVGYLDYASGALGGGGGFAVQSSDAYKITRLLQNLLLQDST